MTTTRLTIVTSARNSIEERLLAGVYGFVREDGTFEVDPILKERIYLFSMMSVRPLPGLQTHTVVIDEEHANALRATLTAALGRRWAHAYAQLAGHHELAQAEGQVVSNAVAEAIASMEAPAYRVRIAKKFKAVQADYQDGYSGGFEDEGDGEDDNGQSGDDGGDWGVPHYRLQALSVLRQTANQPWLVEQAQPLVITTEGISQTQHQAGSGGEGRSQGVSTNYASGTVSATTVIYGATDAARQAVLAAVATLPESLLAEVIDTSNMALEQLTWHTPGEVIAMVRERVAAGQDVSLQEMAMLSPHEDQQSRLIWAEGVLAARALTLSSAVAEEEINLAEAAAAAAPRM